MVNYSIYVSKLVMRTEECIEKDSFLVGICTLIVGNQN